MSLYIGSNKIPDVRISVESPNGYIDTSDATLYRSDHLAAGETAYARRVKYTGTAALDPSVTFENDIVNVPAGIYTSAQNVTIDADSITITQNGTYTPEGDYFSGVVVNVTSEGYETQTKTVTPTTNVQNVTPDAGYDGLSSVTVNPIPSNYIIPSGSVSITENGTVDVSQYASASVNVPTGGSTPALQTKSATPTESAQTVTADNGYDGLSSVEVGAISSTYVGSGIDRKSSTDLTVSGASVTAPAGYYAEAATKSVASGSAGTPTASKGTVSNHAVTVTPSVTNTTGYITGGTKTGTGVSVAASELVSGTLSVTANGTKDVTNYASVSVNVEPTLQSKTVTPTESEQTVTPDSGNDGLSSVTVNAISDTYVGSAIDTRSSSDLTASGATVTVPAGYYAEAASKSVASGSAATPATTVTANPTISISAGGLITATASASQNVTPTVSAGYVSSGTAGTITVSGSKTEQLTTQAAKTVTPTESEQTAVASGIYTTGAVKVGAISSTYVGSGVTRRDDSDLTVSGATVTVPAGYYAAQETKSVASGSAGTPTASKGTVSNHSISVTPSVTNTTGYITGGTKTGTAVTVSASELVSGSTTISSNGTTDVTNLASVTVAVPIVTYYTGSSAPAASLGQDGDIYLQTS